MAQSDQRPSTAPRSRLSPQLVQEFSLVLTKLLEAVMDGPGSNETHDALGKLVNAKGDNGVRKLAYSIKEASEATGLGRNVLYQLVKSESFPSIRLGHRFIIPVHGLEQWLLNQIGQEIETARMPDTVRQSMRARGTSTKRR
jgi:excisionase family DNA binding protein